MPHGSMPSLDGRLYRAALSLCPQNFRREHGDDMARDFDDARCEAAATGERALWQLRFLIAVDLIRTFGVQWLRTPWPVIGLASLLFAVALAEGLATLARGATFQIPDDAAHAEMVGVLLIAVTCVLLIAMTIFLTVWASAPRRRRRR
jgi:hypothetical protein